MNAAGSGRRAGIAVADQAVSSLTNAGVALYLAATSSAQAFGLFAVCATIVQFAVAVTRSSVGEPLAIRHAQDGDRFAAARAGGVSAALVIGLGAGFVLAPIGLFGPAALLATAIVIPGITSFEALRHAELASGRPHRALAMDTAWLAVAIVVLPAVGSAGVAWAVLGWGGGAFVVAATVVVVGRVYPSLTAARVWQRRHSDLLWRLTAEQVLELGALHLTLVGTAVLVSNAAAGGLHAARLLFGPLVIAFLAASAAGLPEASRVVASTARLGRLVRRVSGTLAAIAAGCTLLLLVLPDSAGELLLGDTWNQARPLLLPFGLIHISLGTIQGFRIGLRAREEAQRTLRLRLVLAPLALIGGVGGAAVWGAPGAAWGLALPSVLGAVLWRSAWRSSTPDVARTVAQSGVMSRGVA